MPAQRYHLPALLVALAGAYLLSIRDSEPFHNNDEIRHTMTGVFVRDALLDLPASATDPKGYAVSYYLQYPALGLLTWPPFFYLLEGLAMLAFGPSFIVGRACVAAFAVLAVVYTYRFARLRLPHGPALLATALTGFAPFVFVLSQRVMLEVPTLALALAAVVHFEKYLNDRRGRDAILACLLASLAVLTRFDGVFLLPYFLIRLVATRQFVLLRERPVLVGVTLALALVAPYYLLTLREYGGAIGAAAGTPIEAEPLGVFSLDRALYYPLQSRYVLGWPFALMAVAALVVACVRRWNCIGPYLAFIASVYLTFTPLAELEPRHSIYWTPAWAVLVARFVADLSPAGRGGNIRCRLALLLLAVLVIGGGIELWRQPYRYVRGYEDAARWMLGHRETDRPILADGELSGSIVYHTRLHDPARRVTVLRGDKLLYAMLSDPSVAYTAFARTSVDVLAVLHEYDPEFVVVEDPAPSFRSMAVAGAELLARTLREHPELYQQEKIVSLRSNYDRYDGVKLVIYRKLHRNPHPKSAVAIPVLGLGKSLGGR